MFVSRYIRQREIRWTIVIQQIYCSSILSNAHKIDKLFINKLKLKVSFDLFHLLNLFLTIYLFNEMNRNRCFAGWNLCMKRVYEKPGTPVQKAKRKKLESFGGFCMASKPINFKCQKFNFYLKLIALSSLVHA